MIRKVGIILLLLVLGSWVGAIEPPIGNVPPPEILEEYLPAPEVPIDTSPGGSIGLLKYLPDGTDVEIAGKIVSGLISGEAQTTFYVQEPDRSAGIRVTTEQSVNLEPGDVVDISGTLATTNAERVLDATLVTEYSPSISAPPDSILISLGDIGGGPTDYQPGVVLRVPSGTDTVGLKAVGINNIGLFMKIYGKVTAVYNDGTWEGTYLYVDDGSDMLINADDTDHDRIDQNPGSDVWDGTFHDTVKNLGVRVRAVPDDYGYPQAPVQVDDLVSVQGIVGTRLDSQNRVLPFLQPRTSADISSDVSTSQINSVDCVDAIFGRCFIHEESGQLRYNLACLPLPIVPGTISPCPPEADPMMCEGYLWTHSGLHRAQIQPPPGSDPKHPLNNFRHGAGYWLRQTDCDGISYLAVADDTTDRWIPLPYAWYNLFGHPFNHEVLWSDLKVTDGKRMAGLDEADQFKLRWVNSVGLWWEPERRGCHDIGLPDDAAADDRLRCWHAYHMYAYKPVALIVPGTTYPPGPGIPGRGGIAATVTDTDTPGNPLIGARVYCKYGSALTELPNGTAQIQGLPPGEYLVTASAQGYKSKSQIINVAAGDPTSVSFALESQSGFILCLTANPSRIPPDGTSTSTITARVTDLEGAPLEGKSVTITTDMSTFQQNSTNTVTGDTSDQGILSATLISLTTPNTATLTATCQGASATAYVEFADADSPCLRIVDPANGSNMTGVSLVSVAATSPGGSYPGDVDDLTLYVDGEPFGAPRLVASDAGPSFDSRILSNGNHVLQASATWGETVGWSQQVHVSIYNALSELEINRMELFIDDADPGVLQLTGMANEADDWSVNVLDQSDSVVFSSSGNGPGPIDVVWDGKIGGSYLPGVYRMEFTTGSGGLMSAGGDESWWTYLISYGHATVLITIATRLADTSEPDLRRIGYSDVQSVIDQCHRNGIKFTILADPQWLTGISTTNLGMGNRTRRGLREWLLDPYKCWLNVGHAEWRPCSTAPGPSRMHLCLVDCFVCGADIAAVPIPYGQYRLVQLNSCHSAGQDSGNPDLSFAEAFHISFNSESWFIGWCHGYGDWEYWHGIPYDRLNGSGWTSDFWNLFGESGYTVYAAQSETLLPAGRYWWLTDSMHEYLINVGYPYVMIDDLR